MHIAQSIQAPFITFILFYLLHMYFLWRAKKNVKSEWERDNFNFNIHVFPRKEYFTEEGWKYIKIAYSIIGIGIIIVILMTNQ